MYPARQSIWSRHGPTIGLLLGATAIVLAGGLFGPQDGQLGMAVVLLGSAITIVCFRKAKPSAPVAAKRNKPLFFVAIVYPIIGIVLAVRCLLDEWHWWCPLLVLPIWAGVVCWRFVNQSSQLSVDLQPQEGRAAEAESEEKPDESNS